MTINEFVVKAVGVRFKQHGCEYTGWDCWGLIRKAYKEIYKVTLPEYNIEYENVGDVEKLSELFVHGKALWDKVSKATEGDVVILYMRGRPIHIGLVCENNKMLHVERGIETCLEKISKYRVEGYYQYNECAHIKK